MKKFKPTKRLKTLYRQTGRSSFKNFIRARIKDGCEMARGWYERKGYARKWLNKGG
jgi:hypothetical protein